jgi:hypothetical protein
VRTACAELQLDLLLAYLETGGSGRSGVIGINDGAAVSGAGAEQEVVLAGWVTAAPKRLWELGGRAPQLSHVRGWSGRVGAYAGEGCVKLFA